LMETVYDTGTVTIYRMEDGRWRMEDGE